ncbi:MFS transporter [Xylariales sp. AK1849]|nr:MFS transporter [Xylariales sp. AK1849]
MSLVISMYSKTKGYDFSTNNLVYYYHDVMLKDASSQQLGWITTIAVFLIFAGGVPIGHLVDLYGTRPVVGPFAALGVLSLGLLSLCTQYWQVILCQGVLLGLACGGTTLPAVVCVTQWFSTRRGLAVGLASCGSSFGGLIFPIMISRLIDTQGFAASVRWSTLVVGIGMVVGVTCCEGPFPPKKAQDKARAEAEQESRVESTTTTGGKPEDVEKGDALSGTIGQTSNQQQLTALDSPEPQKSHTSLRNYNLAWLLFFGGTFFCTSTLLAPFNYLPEMAAGSGMDVNLAQYTLAVANGGSTIGRVLPGYLSDHLGQFNVMVMVTVLSTVAMLGIWLPLYYHPSDGGIMFFAAFYGFVSGGYTSLLSPCVVSLANENLADLGVKFGVGCLCLALGALIGIPIVGAVRDNTGSFAGLIGLSGAAMAVGAALMLSTRVKKGGWNMLHKV